MIVIAVYAANERFTLFRADDAGASSVLGEAAFAPQDSSISGHREVGQVLSPSSQPDYCHRLLFDNRTGSYYEGGVVFCGREAEPHVPEPEKPNRLVTVRKFFQR